MLEPLYFKNYILLLIKKTNVSDLYLFVYFIVTKTSQGDNTSI